MVDLRDFLFQKSYVDEMVMCLKAYAFTQCDKCQAMVEHVCFITQYLPEAKHFFSQDNVFKTMNKRCEKYNVDPFEEHEWSYFIHNIEHKWYEQIALMIVMLTV